MAYTTREMGFVTYGQDLDRYIRFRGFDEAKKARVADVANQLISAGMAPSTAWNQATDAGGEITRGVARALVPNMADFMEQTGADFETAADLLYGVVGSNTDVRNWNEIMRSEDPLSAAREATRQMYGSGIDVTGRVPGDILREDISGPATGGITTLVEGTPNGRQMVTLRDAAGNILQRDYLESFNETTGLNNRLAQSYLNRGASLEDLQSLFPDMQFDVQTGSPVSGNFVLSNAAQLAAEAQETARQRLPLDNFTSAMQLSEMYGNELRQLRESQRLDPGNDYIQSLIDRATARAGDLAERTGFVIDPRTGQLVSRPDVPLVYADLGAYPLNLQRMMSPERYAEYVSTFFTGPTNQGTGRGDLQDPYIQSLINPNAVGPGEALYMQQPPAAVLGPIAQTSTSQEQAMSPDVAALTGMQTRGARPTVGPQTQTQTQSLDFSYNPFDGAI